VVGSTHVVASTALVDYRNPVPRYSCETGFSMRPASIVLPQG
jgi:hypothetical protein